MKTELKEAQTKSILTILNKEFPNPVDLKMVQALMDGAGWTLSIHTLTEDCMKLHKAGLVKVETQTGIEYNLAWVTITPKGVKELSRLNA